MWAWRAPPARSSAGIVAASDLAENLLGQAPRLIGGNFPVTTDDDALVGRLPSTIACPVIDDEGLGARGMHADAESREPVVPCDPGLVGGLEGLDRSLGKRQLGLGDAFSESSLYMVSIMHTVHKQSTH